MMTVSNAPAHVSTLFAPNPAPLGIATTPADPGVTPARAASATLRIEVLAPESSIAFTGWSLTWTVSSI